MSRATIILLAAAIAAQSAAVGARAPAFTRMDCLPYPADREQLARQRDRAYRGKVYPFFLSPSFATARYDTDVFFDGEEAESTVVKRSLRIDFSRAEKGFCGAYLVVLADVSEYKTLLFRVRGQNGGENFLLGLKDIISHEQEDALFSGSIHRYLPPGLGQGWQDVAVPLSDFRGLDFTNFFGITLLFEDQGRGTVFIDDIRFSKENVVDRDAEILQRGGLVLDDFDYADLNLLGKPTGCYARFPSVATRERTAEVRRGKQGKCLRLAYRREAAGWAGYYSQLHLNKNRFTDLSPFHALAFWVRGAEGGEAFRVGMADRDHILLDDAVMIEDMHPYLPGGAPKEWTEVVIPFQAFEGLDTGVMGSVVIDFPEAGDGEIFLDDVRFLVDPGKAPGQQQKGMK